MKKVLLSLITLLSAFVGSVSAQTDFEVTFPLKDQTSVSAYQSNWTGKDANGQVWRFVNFNNNKNGWTSIKCGWKTAATSSVISSPLIAEAVQSYAIKVSKTANVKSAKLEVLQSDSTTVVETKTVTMAAGTVTLTLSGTKNAYYRLTIENEQTSANGTTEITGIVLSKQSAYTFNATDKNGKVIKSKFAASPLTVKFAEYEEGMTFKVNGTDAAYNAETGLSITAKTGSKANDKYDVTVYSSKGDSLTTKTYTWIPTATSVSTLKGYEDGTEAILATTAAKVTYVSEDQKNVYIQDATRGILAYNLGITGFTAYKQSTVNIWGKKTTYKTGVVQFQNCDSTIAVSTVTPSATDVTPTARSVAQTKSETYQLTYAKIAGAKIVNDGKNYYAVAGADSVMLYDSFKTGALTALETTPCYADVTGIITIYNGVVEVMPTAAFENVGTGLTGTCGTVTWTIDMDGNMVFKPTTGESGTLATTTIGATSRSWSSYATAIKTIKFEPGVASTTSNSYLFYGLTSLESVDFTNFNTSSLMTVKNMFYNCTGIKNVDFSPLDLAKVTSLESIFNGATALETVNFGENTFAKVTSLKSLFYNCKSLKVADLSKVAPTAVTDLTSVFYGCTSLQKADLRALPTAKVSSSTKIAKFFGEGNYSAAPDTLVLSKNFGKNYLGDYVALPSKFYMAIDKSGNRVADKDFNLPDHQANLYAYNESLEDYGTYVLFVPEYTSYNVKTTVNVKKGAVEKNETFNDQVIKTYKAAGATYVVVPAAQSGNYAMKESTISGVVIENGKISLADGAQPTINYSYNGVEGVVTVSAVEGTLSSGVVNVKVTATSADGLELTVVYTNNTTTGINTVSATNGDAATYNISGQRVANNAKGIVIRGGKKFLNK